MENLLVSLLKFHSPDIQIFALQCKFLIYSETIEMFDGRISDRLISFKQDNIHKAMDILMH